MRHMPRHVERQLVLRHADYRVAIPQSVNDNVFCFYALIFMRSFAVSLSIGGAYDLSYIMEQNARLQEQVSDLVGLLRTALGNGGGQNVQGEGELSVANLQ